MSRATAPTGAPGLLRQLHDLVEGYLAALYLLGDHAGLGLPRTDTGLVHLRAKEVRRIVAADGVGYLEVLHGTLWLTATPATGDVLLRGGDSMTFDGHWPIVVQALAETRLILLPRPPQPLPR